ncbi:MAG: hypothetical protein OHK0039_06240 [Bacteroidia bacterium]
MVAVRVCDDRPCHRPPGVDVEIGAGAVDTRGRERKQIGHNPNNGLWRDWLGLCLRWCLDEKYRKRQQKDKGKWVVL